MLKLNTKMIVPLVKTGARVAVPIGSGFLFGRVGAEVAKAVSPRIAAFAARGNLHEGLVRFFVGVPLSLLLALALARKNKAAFVKYAALAIGGTVATAVQPSAQQYVDSAAAKLKAMLARSGSTAGALPAPSTLTPTKALPSSTFVPTRAAGYPANLVRMSRSAL